MRARSKMDARSKAVEIQIQSRMKFALVLKSSSALTDRVKMTWWAMKLANAGIKAAGQNSTSVATSVIALWLTS